MSVHLRDGTEVGRPQLDRLVRYDERSRRHAVAPRRSGLALRSMTHRGGRVLDQGDVGACVWFSMGGTFLSAPHSVVRPGAVTTRLLLDGYCATQRRDPFPGTDGPAVCGTRAEAPHGGGTSVLDGLLEARDRGLIRGFEWAFGLEQAVYGIRRGPALLGTWWRGDMSRPTSDGRIRWSGAYEGGHAWWLRAVDLRGVRSWLDGQARMRQSWGIGWGEDGEATVSLRDLGAALEAEGECAFAVGRVRDPAVLR